MRLRTHPGQESAGPMASMLGYQLKSMARHPVHMRVTSDLLDCATIASLRMRELFHFNHHQESWLITSCPLSDPRLRMNMYLMSVTLPRASGLLRRHKIKASTRIASRTM